MAEPTPRPWRTHGTVIVSMTGDSDAPLAECNSHWVSAPTCLANATLIVRAVNAHDDLVAAVKGLIDVIDGAADRFALSILSIEVKKKARAALAKAGAT